MGLAITGGVRRRCAAALAAVALAVVPAGCTESASEAASGLEDKARFTVETLLAVCARGEGEAVLDLLTPPQREVFIKGASVYAGCEAVLELGVESRVRAPETFHAAVVESVHVNDDIGTATIRAPDGNTSELELENTGDQWLVSNPPLL